MERWLVVVVRTIASSGQRLCTHTSHVTAYTSMVHGPCGLPTLRQVSSSFIAHCHWCLHCVGDYRNRIEILYAPPPEKPKPFGKTVNLLTLLCNQIQIKHQIQSVAIREAGLSHSTNTVYHESPGHSAHVRPPPRRSRRETEIYKQASNDDSPTFNF